MSAEVCLACRVGAEADKHHRASNCPQTNSQHDPKPHEVNGSRRLRGTVHLVIGGFDQQDEREPAQCAPRRKVPAGTISRRPPRREYERRSNRKLVERHRHEPHAPPEPGNLARRDDERDEVRRSVQRDDGKRSVTKPPAAGPTPTSAASRGRSRAYAGPGLGAWHRIPDCAKSPAGSAPAGRSRVSWMVSRSEQARRFAVAGLQMVAGRSVANAVSDWTVAKSGIARPSGLVPRRRLCLHLVRLHPRRQFHQPEIALVVRPLEHSEIGHYHVHRILPR